MVTRSYATDLKLAAATLAVVAVWVAILVPALCWVGFCRLLELCSRQPR